MEALVSITDDLREWCVDRVFMGNGYAEVLGIADRIDAAHRSALEKLASQVDESEDGWVRLPVDADGVTIRIGDRLSGYNKTIEVVELRYGRSGWVIISRDGNGYVDTAAFTHHAPTVDDVLRQFAREIDADAYGITDAKVAEFAAKLRLAEGVDQ